MKINLKKVVSVLASVVMLGSTISFAAAAWPSPFINNGSGDVAIVVGAGAPADMVAANDLMTSLNAKVTVTGTTSVSGGDSIKLEKSTNKFNLGEEMDTFYSTLDNEELTRVLADGVYENDANNEYDYTQQIAIGNGLELENFLDSDFNDNKPIIGFNLDAGDHILNYTLEFTDEAQGGTGLTDLETTDLTMLGRSYYIVDAAPATSSSGITLTLLDNANSAIVSEGEDATIDVGDKSYAIDIEYISATEVILNVDGVKTNKLEEGDVFKVATDTYVAVKNVLYSEKESGTSKVEISIGTGKITLESGEEVQMNAEAISDITEYNDAVVNAYITNSSNDISKIVLEWNLGDDTFVAPGSDLVLPGFETIKFTMTGFNAPKAEITSLLPDGDDVFTVKTKLTQGSLTLPILYLNDSLTGIKGLGEKATHKLVTNFSDDPIFNLNETENSFFVVSLIDGDDFESYAFEIDSITDDDGKNATKLKNLAGGNDVTFTKVTDDASVGNIDLTLIAASDDAKTASVRATTNTAGILSGAKIVTKEGLRLKLPVSAETAVGDGNINLTAQPTSWNMNITEEDKDGNVEAGNNVIVPINVDADDGLETGTLTGTGVILYETEDGSKKYEGYVESTMATKFLQDRPSSGLNELEITYAGEESTADVYISESAATATSTTSIKVVTDSEVDSAKDKNLIVVGGSCINTVAAKMLGKEAPVCGAEFTALTGVSATKYIIKVAASDYNAQKMAMLVAGYDAADTKTAIDAVIKDGVDASTVSSTVYPLATGI